MLVVGSRDGETTNWKEWTTRIQHADQNRIPSRHAVFSGLWEKTLARLERLEKFSR